MSARATGSSAISRWSAWSSGHWFSTVMLVTAGPARNATNRASPPHRRPGTSGSTAASSPPWEWPTMSTRAAPVAASTLVTNDASCPAEVHVHPQTVRYRLRQVDDLFGDQLRDPDRPFELEITLRARRCCGTPSRRADRHQRRPVPPSRRRRQRSHPSCRRRGPLNPLLEPPMLIVSRLSLRTTDADTRPSFAVCTVPGAERLRGQAGRHDRQRGEHRDEQTAKQQTAKQQTGGLDEKRQRAGAEQGGHDPPGPARRGRSGPARRACRRRRLRSRIPSVARAAGHPRGGQPAARVRQPQRAPQRAPRGLPAAGCAG